MNKQERDLIRKTAELNWEQVIALLDHIDALEGQIEAAFVEGWNKGAGTKNPRDKDWINSRTRAALTQAEEKGK